MPEAVKKLDFSPNVTVCQFFKYKYSVKIKQADNSIFMQVYGRVSTQ